MTSWRNRWLDWLDRVQTLSGRYAFPEDPELKVLRRLHLAGVPADEALALLAQEIEHNVKG